MTHKYITTNTLLACLAKEPGQKKDIHAQLQETIAEHRRIMQQLVQLFSTGQNNEFVMSHKMAA